MMKISRHGSLADHGESSITLSSPTISWDSTNKYLQVKASSIKDFSTDAHHDYTVVISLDELAKMIQVLGTKAVDDCSQDLEASFSGNLKALIKLIAATSGVAR